MEEKYQRKLQTLMKNEGISQSRLAEMLEVKSSTLSHILAGRNYPGFDMLQKLRRLFPHINADWLLLDTSEDYLAAAPTASGRGNADAGSAAEKIAGAAGGSGVVGGSGAVGNSRIVGDSTVAGNTRTAGDSERSAAGTVRGARPVGRTGPVGGGDAQGMAAAPSLFDASSLSNVSSAGTDATSSPLSAQMLSSFDRADGPRIRRIIVLYEDNSFESFTPRP